MDENLNELQNEQSTPETEAEKVTEAEQVVEAEQDSTFAVENVESESALTEILETKPEQPADESQPEEDGEAQTELPAAEEEADEPLEEDENVQELEMTLATYSADCESCATRVYFELDDLNEAGNLTCPNCREEIEIDTEAIDYYLVNKPDVEHDEGSYVADCENCEAVVHFTEDDIDDEENIVCPQCGEKIHIETEVLDAYKEKDMQKALKRKNFIIKFVASALGVLLAVAVSIGALWFFGNRSVLKIDGTNVPMNIYRCVYYIENATNYVSSGYDITQKASDQPYSGEDYETWDDFFKENVQKTLKIYYGIYNMGKKAGYEMPDKDKEEIETTIKNVNSYAQSSNVSFEEYFQNNYGLKLSEKNFREYLELSAYINSYYKSVMAEDITEEQLADIYKNDPAKYDVVSFRYYYVQISDSMSKEEASKQVEAIAAAKSEEEFHSLVKKFVSEDRASTYKEDDSTLIKDMSCSSLLGRPVADLLTNEKSKAGQTACGVSDDDTYAEVVYLVTPRHKSDDLVRDQAINEIASMKGQDFIDKASENTCKASVGMLIVNLTY